MIYNAQTQRADAFGHPRIDSTSLDIWRLRALQFGDFLVLFDEILVATDNEIAGR
jgi:hypothetical protein